MNKKIVKYLVLFTIFAQLFYISQERINSLEKNFQDWSWKPIEDQWLRKLTLLKEYYLKYKTLKIPENLTYKKVNLHNFITVNRSNYNRKKVFINFIYFKICF